MSKLFHITFLNLFLIFLALIFLLVSFTSVVKAENSAPRIEWQKLFGGSESDSALSIQQTSDGGYIIAGYSDSNDGDVTGNHGKDDYWIVKLDSMGTLKCQKSFGGSEIDQAYSIHQTSDGGYIIAGYSSSYDGDVTGNHAYEDYWIVKLNSLGTLQWQKSLGGNGTDRAYSIQQTSDGGYIIAGISNSNNGDVTGDHMKGDYWIVKLDSLGTLQWQKSFGGSRRDFAYCIQQTSDGGYIIAGESWSNDGDVTGNHGKGDYWIVKLDSLGILQWQKSFGGSNQDFPYSIQQTSDGGYIVAGESWSNDGDVTGNHRQQNYWIVKLDSLGILQWQKSLGGSDSEQANSIQQTSDGGYIIAGHSESNDGDVTGNHGKNDYWIVKLNSQGTLQWQKSFGGSGSDSATSIQQTSDGGYIIAGSSYSNDGDVKGNPGKYNDYWIVKLQGQENVQR
ncbi:MAG: T9SS C-terminal target domain-containing protein [Deltaproteobacteria bacterium]|jgi:hypothetical protein|nr:T9SS C-terminal target domain-containing protein [Deltaproteobacteria bacterium]